MYSIISHLKVPIRVLLVPWALSTSSHALASLASGRHSSHLTKATARSLAAGATPGLRQGSLAASPSRSCSVGTGRSRYRRPWRRPRRLHRRRPGSRRRNVRSPILRLDKSGRGILLKNDSLRLTPLSSLCYCHSFSPFITQV